MEGDDGFFDVSGMIELRKTLQFGKWIIYRTEKVKADSLVVWVDQFLERRCTLNALYMGG